MFQHIKTHLSRRQFRLLILLLVVASEYSFLVVPGTFAAGVDQILASSTPSNTVSNVDGWIVMSTTPPAPRPIRTVVSPRVSSAQSVQPHKQVSNIDNWITFTHDANWVKKDKVAKSNNNNSSYNSAPSVSTIPSFPTGSQNTIASSGPYISAPISQVQYSLWSLPGNSNGNQTVNGNQAVNGDIITNGSTTTIGNATVGGNQVINGTTTTSDLVIKNGVGTPTELLGRDSSGSVNRVTLGTGLTLSGGVLVADAGGTITNSSDIATLSWNISTLSGVVSTKITLTDLSATGGISYNSGSGLFSWIGTTDTVMEWLTNLYYTTARFVADFTARFQSAFDAAFGGKTTDNLTEWTGSLYFTDSRAQNALSGTVATITGSIATTNSNLTTLSGNLANTNTDVTILSGRVMVTETNIATLSGKLTQSALIDTLSGASMMLSGITSESANITGTGIISRLVATIANIPTLISSTISAVTANITNLIASVINADTATIGTLTTGNVTSTGTATFNLANFLWNVVFDTLPSLPLSRGSLLVGSNTNKASELSSGGSGQVLVILNGTPVWTDASTVAPVISLFGRTGSVIAQTGDYTTNQVTESGSLYFTNTRARASISATGVVTYDSVNGVIGWNGTTDNVSEWGTNLYYTESRFSGSLATQKNIVNGIAGLDANAKVSIMNLPGITMNSVWTATTKADCTTKTSATRGDICIATSDSKSYILSTTHYELQADWQELLNPAAPVSQVNGQVGNINFVGTNGVTISGTTISLTNVGTGGLYGSATSIPVITTDAQGRVTSVTETTIPTATAGQLWLLSATDYVRFDAKQDFIGTGTTAQYYRWDKTWATLDTSAIPENGNLYFTVSRVRNALSATGALTYNSSTGEFGDAFSFGNGLTRSGNTVGISSVTGTQLSGFTTGQLAFGTASGGLTSTGGLFWDNTNGRLGIGTITPRQKLDIAGSIQANSLNLNATDWNAYASMGVSGYNFYINNSASAGMSLGWNSGNFSFNELSSGTTKMMINGAGNVGIWTTSPNARLEINSGTGGLSGLRFTQLLSSSASNAQYSGILGVNSTGDVGIAQLTGNSFTWFTTGQLTFGTSTGGLTSNSALFWDNTNGRLGVGTNAPTTKFQVTAWPSAVDGLYVRAGADWDAIGFSHDGSIGYINAAGAESGISFRVATGATGNAQTQTYFERMRILANGNVGIWTSSPNYNLSFGTNLANTKLALWDNGTGSSYGLGVKSNEFRFNVAGASADFRFYDSEAGNPLFTIKGNGNIGIGTSSPVYKLNIVDGNTSLRFGAATWSTTDAFLQLRSQTTSNWARIWTNGSPLAIITQWTDETSTGVALFLNNNGNIGIWTTNPSMKLTIQDSTSTSSGSYNKIFGAYSSALSAGASSQIAWWAWNSINNQAEFNFYYAGNSSSSNYVGIGLNWTPSTLSILANWNVGIWTTTPNSKLELNSGTSGASGLRFTQLLSSSASNGQFSGILGVNSTGDVGIAQLTGNSFSGFTAGQLAFGTATGGLSQSSNLFWGNTNARLGIGTSAPISKLDVVGDIGARFGTDTTRIVGIGLDGSFGVGKTGIFRFADPANQLEVTFNDTMKLRAYNGFQVFNNLGEVARFGMAWWTSLNTYFNGNVGIWTASPAYKLEVSGDINAIGTVRANGVALTSDARFKTNISTITNSTDIISELNPVTYVWNALGIEHGGKSGVTQYGFLAQDVEFILPSAVSTSADGYKSLNYIDFIPHLVGAVKELITTDATMSGQISTLSGQVALLSQNSGSISNTTVVNNYISSSSATGLIMSGTGQAATDALATVQAETPRSALSYITDMFAHAFEVVRDFVTLQITAVRGYFDEIFARTTHTETLCIGTAGNETCITKAQLDALLTGAAQSPAPIVPPASGSDPSSSSGSSSSGSDILSGSTTPPTSILGCMDSTATNYSSTATEDDGSCIAPVVVPDPVTSPEPTTGTGA